MQHIYEPPKRFSLADPFDNYVESYKEHYKKTYGKEWDNNMLEVNYLNDLKEGILNLDNYN